jgi:seryl-tRNA synthetase
MAEFRPAVGDQAAFRDTLVEHGYFAPSGVPGVYGRSARFEDIRMAFDRMVTRAAAVDTPESLVFPPVLPRKQLEASGYLSSFPHLAGSVFGFAGDEAQAGEMQARAAEHEDWAGYLGQTDLVLTPAACYPVYPHVATRGPVAAGGVTIDAGDAYVFRHEPADDPARLQMFHQREIVRIGEPETVEAWRDAWRDRAIDLLLRVGLDAEFDVASDPFFGRTGRLMARSQRSQALKFEVLVPIASPEKTAVASFNYHRDHFTSRYGIAMDGGGEAHTACLGFGEERIVLALLRKHGVGVDGWPEEVRRELWPA